MPAFVRGHEQIYGGNRMPSNDGKQVNLKMDWRTNPRWEGISRPYGPADAERLRGSIHIEHTLAHVGSQRLWSLLH